MFKGAPDRILKIGENLHPDPAIRKALFENCGVSATAVKLRNCRISEPQIVTYRSRGENSEEDRVKTPENLAYVAHRANENKMSDGGRERAWLGVKMWKSS